jgi:hypothetical protein
MHRDTTSCLIALAGASPYAPGISEVELSISVRKKGALLLALMMTACATTPRPWPEAADPYERELEAARYELRVLTADTGDDEPVAVDKQDFQRALRVLAPGIPLQTAPARPHTGSWKASCKPPCWRRYSAGR